MLASTCVLAQLQCAVGLVPSDDDIIGGAGTKADSAESTFSSEADLSNVGDAGESDSVTDGGEAGTETDEGSSTDVEATSGDDDDFTLKVESTQPTDVLGIEGELFEDSCPEGELLIGLEGRHKFDDVHPQGVFVNTRGKCAEPILDPGQPRLRIEPTGHTPWRGYSETTGDDWNRMCPVDYVVERIDLRMNRWPGGLSLHCVTLELVEGEEGLAIEHGEVIVLDNVGDTNGSQDPLKCGEKAMASGPRIRIGPTGAAGLGLMCRSTTIVPAN